MSRRRKRRTGIAPALGMRLIFAVRSLFCFFHVYYITAVVKLLGQYRFTFDPLRVIYIPVAF